MVFDAYVYDPSANTWSSPRRFSYECRGQQPQPHVVPRVSVGQVPPAIQAGATKAVYVDYTDPNERVYRFTIDRAPGGQAPGWVPEGGRLGIRTPGTKQFTVYLKCTTPGVRYTLRAALYAWTGTTTEEVVFKDFSFLCVGSAPAPGLQANSPARITQVKLANAAKVVIGGDRLTGRVYLTDPTGVVAAIYITASGPAAGGVSVSQSIPVGGTNDPNYGLPFYFSCYTNGAVRLLFTLVDRSGRALGGYPYNLSCFSSR